MSKPNTPTHTLSLMMLIYEWKTYRETDIDSFIISTTTTTTTMKKNQFFDYFFLQEFIYHSRIGLQSLNIYQLWKQTNKPNIYDLYRFGIKF